MIKTKKELKEVLTLEKGIYFDSFIDYLRKKTSHREAYYIYKFLKRLRKCEYYYNNKKMLRYRYYYSKKNKCGIKIGVNISINTVDAGINIYHCGSIVINQKARIGKNLKLHGCNCIGNNVLSSEAPILGDNCDLGYGSIVIGNITLGNNCIIGANSLVNKSFPDNSKIVGSPGKTI